MPKTVIRKSVPNRPTPTVGDLNQTQRNGLRSRLKEAGINITGLMTNKTPVAKLNKMISSKKK